MGRNQGLNRTTPAGWDSVTGPSSPGLIVGACVPARFEAGASGQFSHSPVPWPSVCRQSGVSCSVRGAGEAPAQMGLYSSVVTYFFL